MRETFRSQMGRPLELAAGIAGLRWARPMPREAQPSDAGLQLAFHKGALPPRVLNPAAQLPDRWQDAWALIPDLKKTTLVNSARPATSSICPIVSWHRESGDLLVAIHAFNRTGVSS
jgi:hypothetical protein